MWRYPFLVLSLMMWVPALPIWLGRPDLRKVIRPMALAALPFAATERLFYPEYWSPPFVLDLVNRIGFGLEDVLFVVALAAVTSTSYAVLTGSGYAPCEKARQAFSWQRSLPAVSGVLAICFALVALFVWLDIAMIYGACIIMVGMGASLCAMRRDLWWPSVVGALATTGLYFGICLTLELLLPNVFAKHWHTEKFLDLYLVGVPLEELLYAGGAGFVATCFYPFVTRQKFVAR